VKRDENFRANDCRDIIGSCPARQIAPAIENPDAPHGRQNPRACQMSRLRNKQEISGENLKVTAAKMLPEQPGFCRTSLAAINQTGSPNPNRASTTIGGPEENSMRGSEGFTSEVKLGKVKRSFPRHGIKPAQLQTSYLFEEDDISEGDLIQRKKSKTGDM